jgi:FkbM family methyltransferase
VPRPVVESTFTHDRFALERRGIEHVLTHLRPDDVVFDVGAMFGLYTALAGQNLPDGSVVAFEPYPENIAALERTIELNDLSNVSVHEVALGDANGSAEFESPSLAYQAERLAHVRDQRARGAGRPSLPDEDELSESRIVRFTAETRTGDSLVETGATPRPTVVKIDVEGAEALVVEGMRETLASDACRCLVCEVHPPDDGTAAGERSEGSIEDYGGTVADLVETVERLGFETELETGDGYMHLRGLK